MALVQVDGPLGAPWERPLAGRFESLAVESELLRDNPLGDPARRPDVFSAFASHAGDALFECCYLPEFPVVARALRDHFEGSFDVLLERMRAAETFDWSRFGAALSTYAMAAAYSPGQLPFEI